MTHAETGRDERAKPLREPQGRPWYREPWPWILMAGPAAVVVAGFVTLWLAATTFDGMVVDDYYKQGLAINRALERDRAAARLGLGAEVALAGEAHRIRVALTGGALSGEQRLRLRLAHPAHADLDQDIALERAGGAYEGGLQPLRPGRWTVTLEDEAGTWRLMGVWRVPEEAVLRLRAAGESQR
jgi:hypothetical protein